LKTAYAEIVIKEYAEKFAGLLDGYWFDHCSSNFCDGAAVKRVINKADPKAVLSFNSHGKSNSPWDDYKCGHPTPVERIIRGVYRPAYACLNEPMIKTIENGEDGYVTDKYGTALGHMFMPAHGNGWNDVGCVQTAWTEGVILRRSRGC